MFLLSSPNLRHLYAVLLKWYGLADHNGTDGFKGRDAPSDLLQGICVYSGLLLILVFGVARSTYEDTRVRTGIRWRGGVRTWEPLCLRLRLVWSPARRRRAGLGIVVALPVLREGSIDGGPALAVLAGWRRRRLGLPQPLFGFPDTGLDLLELLRVARHGLLSG